MRLRERVNAELEALRVQHDGVLKQEHVVEFAAREKGSALYEDFDQQGLWDDTIAAHRGRLEYAGRVIRLAVTILPGKPSPPVRVFVSLVQDRQPDSGLPGYRHIADVLADPRHRANMLATARMELRGLRRKYDALHELARVWGAIDDATSDEQGEPD